MGGEKGKPFTWKEIGDRFNLVLAKHSLQVEFIEVPWKRCLRNLSRSDVEGAALIIWNSNRDNWIAFPKKNGDLGESLDRSLSLKKVSYPIIYNPANPVSIKDGEIFPSQGNIGAPIGYVVYEKLKSMERLTAQNYDPYQGFNAIINQSILGYSMERKTAEIILASNEFKNNNLQFTELSLLEEDLFIGLSKGFANNHKEKATLFWQLSRDFFHSLPQL